MPFAYRLHDSLRDRHSQVPGEFAAGESLETILGRHLLAIEASADTELLTSILLLDESGTRILHGAAPRLPKAYCDAIHGSEIGPRAGSCGTAAYNGHPIYVSDIATDPLWDDYRHLALPHGLKACWSTPIRGPEGKVIGTFAIYHLTPRSPIAAEVEAIRLITDHVSQTIMWSRAESVEPDLPEAEGTTSLPPPNLRLVGDHEPTSKSHEPPQNQGLDPAGRFRSFAMKLDRFADMVESRKFAAALKAAADDCRKLGDAARDCPGEH